MKYINKLTLFVLTAVLVFACEDEELKQRNYPGWETGVNGFGQFQDGSAVNFIRGNTAVDLDFDFRWISIDGDNTVESIEFYIEFEESYINKDGDPAVANHGLQLVNTVASAPGNREDLSFTLTQADVYNAFQSAEFDYDEDGTATPVFNNPDKPLRDPATIPLVDGDSFTLSWILYTADGRVFDSWSPSTCTELPGSNCELSWIVECGQDINNKNQEFTMNFNDSYGDGWNDAAIRVIIDGQATDYTIDDGSSATYTFTPPPGTQTLAFEFISGDWDSEVTFEIITESGNVIAAGGPSPSAGAITLDLCTENS